jgi:hypothetical protein
MSVVSEIYQEFNKQWTHFDSITQFKPAGDKTGPTLVDGMLGKAYDFDGVDDGIYIEGSAGRGSHLNIYNTDITISAWVNIRRGGSIVARAKPHYITYQLRASTKAYVNMYISPVHYQVETDEILVPNTWYHIVGVFDRAADKGYVYIDGVLEAEGPLPDAPSTNDGLTKIGCRNNVTDGRFDGKIDDVRIYNRVLNTEEIKQLYNRALNTEEIKELYGFVALFNGNDLTGWKGLVGNPVMRAKMSPQDLAEAQLRADEQMRAHWKVVDGVLVFDGKGQNLCTAKDYGDFELLIDWKIESDSDSGLYLRGSPQVQIWNPVQRPEGSGGLYNNKKGPGKPLKCADNPVGQWNTFRIIMTGERVTVYLNDVLVVDDVVFENYWEHDKPIYPVGQIELQAYSGPIYFRNIFIREIPPT